MIRLAAVTLMVAALVVAGCGAEPIPTRAPSTKVVPPTLPPSQATPTAGTFQSPLAPPAATGGAFESPLAPGLPNPASVHCIEQGYELEMRTDDKGTSGYCLFPDGSECEEWAFFRGECAPGAAP
jgi:putative hemolysin